MAGDPEADRKPGLLKASILIRRSVPHCRPETVLLQWKSSVWLVSVQKESKSAMGNVDLEWFAARILTSGGGSSKNELTALSVSQLDRSRTKPAWKSLQPVMAETCCINEARSVIVPLRSFPDCNIGGDATDEVALVSQGEGEDEEVRKVLVSRSVRRATHRQTRAMWSGGEEGLTSRPKMAFFQIFSLPLRCGSSALNQPFCTLSCSASHYDHHTSPSP